MKRTAILLFVALGSCAGGDRGAAPRPPNVVFILADDLGAAELGCYGQEKIRTPHIDRLAAEGMRFTRAYAGNAVCAPSRCSLMTGKHPGHAYIRNNGNPPDRKGREEEGFFPGQNPIPDSEVTIAEILKARGYATGAAGKWGLGYEGSTGDPLKQGFDHFYGYLCQGHAHNHYPAYLWRDGVKEPLPGNSHGPTGKIHAQDKFTEAALDFLRANRARPFFLFLPFTIPHVSIQVPEESLDEYRGKFPEEEYVDRSRYVRHPSPRAGYAAMVSHMDRAVGKVMDEIRALGLDGETIVFFSSDNGPTHDRVGGSDSTFFKSAGGLRGLKGSLYEGGIRVPLLVRWPGKVRAGATSDHATAFWDVLPTIAELAGAQAPGGIDGLSFAPELLGGTQRRHEFLYWEFPAYGGQQAVRWGDWKGVRQKMLVKGNADPLRIELYDLAKDPGETTDVAAKHPEVVARIAEIMSREHVPSALFPLAPVDPPPGGDCHVDNVKGDDARDGKTAATAFRTLRRAAAALRPGDTLHLARNEEPYRESLVLTSGGTAEKPIVIDGHGATISGLDPAPADRFVFHEAGIIKGRLPEFHRDQPRAVVNEVPMASEGRVSELHEGQHTWMREMVYIALPEGVKWPGARLAFMTRSKGVSIEGASHVVVRNLAVEQVSGDAFAVQGAARGVRFENVEGRRASGGTSRGLFVRDGAEVSVAGSRFHGNSTGVAAIHRARTVLERCEVRGNEHFGARVNGAEHVFADCVFADNGAFDLEVLSLSPESGNGGGPCRARLARSLFRGGTKAALVVRLGDHGGEVEVSESVFLKPAGLTVRYRGGTYRGDYNLFQGAGFDLEDRSGDLAAWQGATKADAHSQSAAAAPDRGPWTVGGRSVGPR